jgi:hypothetical protein
MPSIIQDEFETYLSKVYPDQPIKGSDQYEQLRDAFFGGMHIAIEWDSAMVRRELKAFVAEKKAKLWHA